MTTIDIWLAGRSLNTARTYRRSLEDWRAWLHPTDPARASRQEAAAWIASLQQTRKPATVAARVAAVHSYHQHLISRGLARANPFADLPRPVVARYGAAQVLTVPQLRTLWAHLTVTAALDPADTPASRQRDRALISFLLNTGRRPAEIASLQWIDLEPDPLGGYLLYWHDGRRAHSQPLPEHCHAALRAWYAAAGWPILPAAYLWRRLRVAQCANLPTVAGSVDDEGPITAAQIGAIVRRIGRQAGIDYLTPAVLRNTFAALYSSVQGIVDDLPDLLNQSPASSRSHLRTPALRTAIAEYSAALGVLTT